MLTNELINFFDYIKKNNSEIKQCSIKIKSGAFCTVRANDFDRLCKLATDSGFSLVSVDSLGYGRKEITFEIQ